MATTTTRRSDGAPAGVDLVELYRQMLLLRVFDERAVTYQRQGQTCTYALTWGSEAVIVGAVSALDDDDWLFPSYRELSVGLLRGMSPAVPLLWLRGHPEGSWDPHEWKIAPAAIPVGSHVPHAAGLAWGMKLLRKKTVACVFFGDGATSEGAFHEGINLAGVKRAPLVLVCNNNGFAISTPVAEQTAAVRLSDKAAGYGIAGVTVNGTDVVAVHEAVAEAAARARAGDGPTLVECVHYRAAAHATSDDPTMYLDAERAREARRREPVAVLERQLRRNFRLDEDAIAVMRGEYEELVRQGMETALAARATTENDVLDFVYAEPPADLR